MTPEEIIALTNAGITLLQIAIPALQSAVKSGDITVAQQQQVANALNGLGLPAAFSGPEWKPSTAAG